MKTYSLESEIAGLKREVEELRGKIQRLRASRRILMDILAMQTRDTAQQVKELERENRKLKKSRHTATPLLVVSGHTTPESLRSRH